LLDNVRRAATIYLNLNGLFSVPAPLFDLLAGSSAGFFLARSLVFSCGPRPAAPLI
jgi:hypothetical protein